MSQQSLLHLWDGNNVLHALLRAGYIHPSSAQEVRILRLKGLAILLEVTLYDTHSVLSCSLDPEVPSIRQGPAQKGREADSISVNVDRIVTVAGDLNEICIRSCQPQKRGGQCVLDPFKRLKAIYSIQTIHYNDW